jgi:hypothetical protein
MSRQKIIGIIVVLLSILVLVIYQLAQVSKDFPLRQKSLPPNPSGTQSLRSLLKSPNSQICTHSNEKIGSNIKLFISNGKVKGEVVNSLNQKTSTSYMFSDSQAIYFWTQDSGTGYKSTVQSEGAPSDDSRVNLQIDQQVDYQCQPWTVDESVFTLPDTIKFVDLNSFIPSSSGN